MLLKHSVFGCLIGAVGSADDWCSAIYSIYWLSWFTISLCIYLLCNSASASDPGVARKQCCLWNCISALLIFILFHLYPWILQAFIRERNRWYGLKLDQYTTCTKLAIVIICATWTSFFGTVSVAQLEASMSGVVLGGVVEVVCSNLARGEILIFV